MQSRPMQNLDLFRVEIEALREQTPQLARTSARLQRMPQLHYTAPLARRRRGQRLLLAGYEVRVVLGSHGGKRNFAAPRRP
jgi:hypothetical protein